MGTKILNGRITGVELTNLDHDQLTAFIQIEHERGSQAFGGWQLYAPSFREDDRTGWFIWRTIETVFGGDGYGKWDKLIGKPVRVKTNEMDLLIAVGNFVQDIWFEPKKEMEDYAKKQNGRN